ncbi:unnamed protein product [Pedinophyceae sp. YPF-701]|nr:unnamed protein product [Pedinophyceae sp. YPF-701]
MLQAARRAAGRAQTGSVPALCATMASLHKSPAGGITELIGNTPVVKLKKLSPEGREVFVKLENQNPGGSVKDRLALGVIKDAIAKGELKPGQTVVEATSGNTGIGLALVCAEYGHPLVVTMAEIFSIERRKLMRAMGAKVVLTPAYARAAGMVDKATELAEKHGWFLTRQFFNDANWKYHYDTTGVEICDMFEKDGLDYFLAGWGTGGTIRGCAKRIKERMPATKVVASEPENAALLSSGIKSEWDGEQLRAPHPTFMPHPLQGWVPDFIPPVVEGARSEGLIDMVRTVKGAAAIEYAKLLAQQEGIFSGISGGGNVACAIELAKASPPGTRVLTVIPDTGERYLSTPLCSDIPEGMTDEEKAISESTPLAVFGKPPPPPKPAAAAAAAAAAPDDPSYDAAAFCREAAASAPLVIFSLEWCEFCWSVKNFLKAVGVEYKAVNLDSVENKPHFKQNRAALKELANSGTVPQIFIGGQVVEGGCTGTLDSYTTGEMQERLGKLGVAVHKVDGIDPRSFLPQWARHKG